MNMSVPAEENLNFGMSIVRKVSGDGSMAKQVLLTLETERPPPLAGRST